MKQLVDAGRMFMVGSVLVLTGCAPLDVGTTGQDGAMVAGPNDAGATPFDVVNTGSDGAGTVMGPPDEGTITGLHFTTSSAFPDNPPPTNVDVTLTDPIPARAVYSATLALPDFPPGRYNCPVDLGYSHTITFMNGQAVAATATLNAGGCREVTISGAPPLRWTATDEPYWALLAQNLGVQESTLFSLASP
jgi:hypothetical protein